MFCEIFLIIIIYLCVGFLFSAIRYGVINKEVTDKEFSSIVLFYPLYFIKWIIQLIFSFFKLFFETIKYLIISLFEF